MARVLELILLVAPCGYLVLTSVNNLTITQSPSELQLLVGQSVEIICSWNVSSEVEQFRVEWKKVSHVQDSVTHPTKTLKDNATLIKKNLYDRNVFIQDPGKEPLELKNLKVHDSGLYLCKITVDIPIYKQAQGPGTLLTVKEKNTKKQWPWWTLVIFLLLTFSTCLSYYCKKRKNSQRIEPNRTDQEEKEDTEYIEMKRKMKENKRTPSNTTEWSCSIKDNNSLPDWTHHQASLFVQRREVKNIDKMSELETAMGMLIDVFDRYAGTDGNKETLTKGELKTLMEKEFPNFVKNGKNNEVVDKLFADLDNNGDSQVDFNEFVVFVAALTSACHKYCHQKGPK
uniref:Protein S100-P n=2 Tax=Vombatus ursinus TaxID=29139 RepID=A0A4X2LTZ6_VOMUR